jgi:hypothetical protein
VRNRPCGRHPAGQPAFLPRPPASTPRPPCRAARG